MEELVSVSEGLSLLCAKKEVAVWLGGPSKVW